MASGSLSLPPVTGASTQNSQWEGDKMFNIYIYDYCNKRGFRETAQKLMVEAEIPPDSAPPINAKQGLLFEWWSVFWVLFTAKSSGTGSDDAMLYVQQQSQAAQRQAQARMPPQQQNMNRFANGMQRQPGSMPPNGQMPNGVGPASIQGAQGPMPNGVPSSMSFPMSQPNGIPGTPAGPSAPGSIPQQQQPGFQSMLPNQRPGGPQQRGPTNGPPFQSPTMAHSPQNPGGGPVQQQPPPMGQLGPSPHMSHMQRGGNMLPPNGQHQATSPAFQQLQRTPSRTASPSNIMPQPSPSMAARQPPGVMANPAQDVSFNNELSKIPGHILIAARQDMNLGDKDPQLYTPDEKQRFITAARQRIGNMKPGPHGANNAAAGPSMQPAQRPQRQSVSQQRGNKRNSTSPADEHESLPRNDQSPPDRKRPRRSPLSAEQGHPMGSTNYPQQGQQPAGGQGGPLSNGMMRPMGGTPMGGPVLNGFPPGGGGMQNMGNNPGVNMQMAVPQMNQQGIAAAQQMARYQQEQQYRQSMHTLHKGLPAGPLNNGMPGNAGSPSSGDSQGQGPQFAGAGGPNNRMNPKGMMLPPSPASGPSKDQSGQNKDKGGQPPPSNRPEGSPRNPPRTPAQGGSNIGNSGQGGTAPPTPNMTAPSPSAILGNPPVMNQPGPPMAPAPDPMAIFAGTDFMSSMPVLDGFDDASLSKTNFDVDFERDFGQWFNPENDVTGSLDPQ